MATALTNLAMRSMALLAIGAVAPLISGCIRTDDGTVLWSQHTIPLGMTSVADPANYSRRIRDRRERERLATEFPAAPRALERRTGPRDRLAPKIAPVRVGVAAPFKPAPAIDKNLDCHDETTPSGRVKVVCE